MVFVNKLNFYKSGNTLSFRSPVYIIEQKWLPRMEFDHLHLEKSKTVNYFMKSNSVNVAFVIQKSLFRQFKIKRDQDIITIVGRGGGLLRTTYVQE